MPVLDKNAEHDLYVRWKANSLVRWMGMGATEDHIFEAYSKIDSLGVWCREFSKIAEKYEKAGDAALEPMVKGANYRAAAIYYHIAQLSIFEDNEERRQAFFASDKAYAKGAPYYFYPVEIVHYPYAGIRMKAYFRKNPKSPDAPTIVVVRGADASREGESHVITNYLVDKGFKTLDIDCGGQGYARWQGLKMTPDFEKPVGAAIDYLMTRSDVNPDKIGIHGTCVGGFIAPRAASLEKRIKACISLGGFYALDEFEYPLTAVLNLQNNMEIKPEQWQSERKKYTLAGTIEQMTCPLLVVNGSEDKTLPVGECIKIYDHAKCQKELKIYQGYGHNAYTENRYAMVYMAKWLWDKLN